MKRLDLSELRYMDFDDMVAQLSDMYSQSNSRVYKMMDNESWNILWISIKDYVRNIGAGIFSKPGNATMIDNNAIFTPDRKYIFNSQERHMVAYRITEARLEERCKGL